MNLRTEADGADEKPGSQSSVRGRQKAQGTGAAASSPEWPVVTFGAARDRAPTFLGFSGVGASSTDASISLAGIHVS